MIRSLRLGTAATVALLGSLALTACSGSSSSPAGTVTSPSSGLLPLLTPIVKQAIPTGLGGSAGTQMRSIGHILDQNVDGTGQLTTDTGYLTSRFFSAQGPSQIVAFLMPQLDTLITNVNTTAASSTSACLTQTPVAYNLTTPGGTVQMYAQCYTSGTANYAAASADGVSAAADPAFMQFGVKDGVIYIWSAWAAEWVGAIVTPITGGGYSVTAYIGLGYANIATTGAYGGHWDTMGYGLMEFNANSSTGTFELAVAGLGFGFCGGQLSSDGSKVYAIISNDMGSNCGTDQSGSWVTDDLCVNATDLSATTGCTTSFNLTPIGRILTAGTTASIVSGGNWAASTYPTSPNLTINGSSSDSIHVLGPISPTTGVGQLSSGGGDGGVPTAAQIAAIIESGGQGGCTISDSAATTAANAAIAELNSGGSQTDAENALNTSLTSSGVSGAQVTCADNALNN